MMFILSIILDFSRTEVNTFLVQNRIIPLFNHRKGAYKEAALPTGAHEWSSWRDSPEQGRRAGTSRQADRREAGAS